MEKLKLILKVLTINYKKRYSELKLFESTWIVILALEGDCFAKLLQ